MSQNNNQNDAVWKCESCDTINTGAVCSVCGACRPLDGNNSAIEKKTLSMAEENKYYSLLLDAREFRKKEQYEDELRTLMKAAEIDDSAYDLWFALGKAFKDNDFFSKSIECYRKAIDKGDLSWQVWNNLGAAYEKNNYISEAVSCLEKAISIIPKTDVSYGIVLANYGLTIGLLGDKQRAAQLLNEAESLGRDVTGKRERLGL